ncbi:sigma-70 family RNA polymerase sigma factor [Lentzea sp. NPDC051213]|uniref:sigma-70 family RNA polymerase sigma factor n=1 Tax=Lentzea sp. NPDC051213 TaxID=3364126 RepID=UPI0037BE146F
MTVKPDELTPALFMRLYSVMELRQRITPDPARAEVLKSLQALRNDVAHSASSTEDVLRKLAPMLPELVDYLHVLENSSLGTPFAKSMRALSTPEAINDVLLRSIQREEAEHRRAHEAQTASNAAPIRKEESVREATVRAAITGDRAALDKVMSSLRPLVRRYCRVLLDVSGPDAEAIVDEVTDIICVTIEEALPSLENGKGLTAFAYGIAAHHVTQLLHATRKPEPSENIGDLSETIGDLSEHMARLLKLLPPKQREVLLLRVVVGLSAEETAEAVGSTPGAVRIAQHRALANLRKQVSRLANPRTSDRNIAEF